MFKNASVEIAKILRKLAKDNQIKASIQSKKHAWSSSVNVFIKEGTDNNLEIFKRFALQYKYNREYNIDDSYTITNRREDIPQTDHIWIYDKRA